MRDELSRRQGEEHTLGRLYACQQLHRPGLAMRGYDGHGTRTGSKRTAMAARSGSSPKYKYISISASLSSRSLDPRSISNPLASQSCRLINYLVFKLNKPGPPWLSHQRVCSQSRESQHWSRQHRLFPNRKSQLLFPSVT